MKTCLVTPHAFCRFEVLLWCAPGPAHAVRRARFSDMRWSNNGPPVFLGKAEGDEHLLVR